MYRRIPYIPQMSTSDCGYACLAMLIAWHGGRTSLLELREAGGNPRGGLRATELIELAQAQGLNAAGHRVPRPAWGEIKRGAILHLNGRHFVVFDRHRKNGVEICDPARGRRWLSLDEFEASFSGVTIVLTPGIALSTATRQPRSWRRYVAVLRTHWGRLAAVVVTSLLLAGISIVLPLGTGVVIDRVVPDSNRTLLATLSGGAAAFLVAQFVVSWIRGCWLVRLRLELDDELTTAFMTHLLALPYAFFFARGTGDLLQRLRSNAQVRELITNAALVGFLDGVLTVGYMISLLVMSLPMALVSTALGAVFALLVANFRRRRHELSGRQLHASSTVSSFEVGILNCIETIKSMGAESRILERWSIHFGGVLDANRQQGIHEASIEAWTSMLRTATPLVLVLFGTHLVLRGELSLGTMLAVCALAGGFLMRLASLANTAMRWPILRSHVERLADILNSRTERKGGNVVDAPMGELVLKDVGFSYSRREAPILRDVNLRVPAGTFVALVGGSGTGKSTLARLIAGLYEPQHGTVTIDGSNYSNTSLESLRNCLGVVTQDPQLLPLTIAENIALGRPDLSMQAIVEAARIAEIHDDIESLPLGYHTQLDTSACGLSGGQRQRIALARAIAPNPPIVILDEATSALDPILERRIQGRLARLQCTVLVISHRMSTVRDADMIAVVANGSIRETGTHSELTSLNGAYARLTAASQGSREVA